MFTLKQETGSGHMLWTDIETVSAEALQAPGSIDVVFARPKSGGEFRFDASPGQNDIYVMNDAGSTVARYHLGHRAMSPLSGPAQADYSPASQLEV